MVTLASDNELLILDGFTYWIALVVCSGVNIALLTKLTPPRSRLVAAYVIITIVCTVLSWTVPRALINASTHDILFTTEAYGIPLVSAWLLLSAVPIGVMLVLLLRTRALRPLKLAAVVLAMCILQLAPPLLYVPHTRRVTAFQRSNSADLLAGVDRCIGIVCLNPDDDWVWLHSIGSTSASKIAYAGDAPSDAWLFAHRWTDGFELSLYTPVTGWKSLAPQFCTWAATEQAEASGPTRGSILRFGAVTPGADLFIEDAVFHSVLRIRLPGADTGEYADFGAVYPWFRAHTTPPTWLSESVLVVGISQDTYVIDVSRRAYAWFGRGQSPVVVDRHSVLIP